MEDRHQDFSHQEPLEPEEAQDKKLSRRNFLRLGAVAVASIPGAYVAKELGTALIQEQMIVELPNAQIHILPEHHNVGIPLTEIPPESAAHFYEYTINPHPDDYSGPEEDIQLHNILYQLPPEEIIRILAPGQYQEFEYLARNHIPQLLLDITTPDRFTYNKDIIEANNLALLIAGLGAGTRLSAPLVDDKSRRGFLKKFGVAMLSLAGYKLSTQLSTNRQLPQIRQNQEQALTPLERVLIRLGGLQSSIHPEHPKMMMRNLIWAIKIFDLLEQPDFLTTFSDDQTPPSKEKPIIACQIGADHGGLIDFLQLGKGTCIHILRAAFTLHFSAEVAQLNGGAESISTSLALTLPENLQVDKPETFAGTTEKRRVCPELADFFTFAVDHKAKLTLQ